MIASLLIMLVSTVLVGGLLFGSAGRFDLPMVWAYIATFFSVSVASILLMQRYTPELLKVRQGMGPSDVPDLLYRLALPVGFGSHFVIAGLDVGRFHWSDTIPLPVQIIGLIGFAVGIGMGTWAALTNPFFTGEVRIQEDRGQHVITAGPYNYVRHPGYAGGVLFFLCSGLALGSWLSIVPMLLVVATLIRRTALEDQMLRQRLGGYADYASKVGFRLIPGVW